MANQLKRDLGSVIPGLAVLGLVAWGVISGINTPVITTETLDLTSSIPYELEIEYSDDIYAGDSEVTQEGEAGELITQYEVTYEDGVEIGRDLVDEWVNVSPVSEITTYGTYVEPTDYYYPSYNYSGYGSFNDAGCVKDQYVSGYFRSNGTYVSGYWRNSPYDNCY